MAPVHRFGGIGLLFVAFILLVVASVSTPFFRNVDIAHTSQVLIQGVTSEEVRYGIWGACKSVTRVATICQHLGHGYNTINNLLSFVPVENTSASAGVQSSWTRGLAIHPVAAIIAFIAFVLSLLGSQQLATVLVGSIGALVTLIAIAIDIAFLLLTRHAIDEITGSASTSFGAGFWLTLVGFLATTGATVLLFIHRRESNDSWDSDPGSFSLGFLKNPLSRFRN